MYGADCALRKGDLLGHARCPFRFCQKTQKVRLAAAKIGCYFRIFHASEPFLEPT